MGKGGIDDKDDRSVFGELRRETGQDPPNKVCSVTCFAEETASVNHFTCVEPVAACWCEGGAWDDWQKPKEGWPVAALRQTLETATS